MRLKKKASAVIIILIALITIVGLTDFNFITKPVSRERMESASTMTTISLLASDNKKIAGNYFKVEKNKYPEPRGWVVFVHMMPATKESWTELAGKLQSEGYESLAVDLRGHGESEGGPNGFVEFSDREYQAGINDLKAAADFLKSRGAVSERMIFIGASIGANLSLQYASENNNVKIFILLSPGLNYRGVKTEPMARNVRRGQRFLLISSKDDGGNDNETEKIFGEISADAEKELKIYKTGGHGTDILTNQPDAENIIINFIKK